MANSNLISEKPKKRSFSELFLQKIEVVGNKLFDPLSLFLIMAAIILICSAILGSMGVTAVNPVTKKVIHVVNLLDGKGLIKILENFTSNIANFPPFAVVLVCMLGIGISESTGFVSALLRHTLLKAPQALVVPTLFFLGINSNIAADAGFIIMPIIGAMIFGAIGKHPIAGMIAGYAGVSGGFSANLLVGTTDALLFGFTQKSAQMLMPGYEGNVAMNWYFNAVSTVFLIFVGTWVNNKIIEPRFGKYTGPQVKYEESSEEEKRGLRWAAIAAGITTLVLAALSLPSGALLQDPKTGSLATNAAPFMKSIVTIIMIFFLIPSLAYGFGAKVLKSDKDVSKHLAKSMAGMAPYIVFVSIAAQMIAFFSWSNLGPVSAIKGAEFLKSIGLTGTPAVLVFLVFSCLLNLVVTSASAKWAIMAPVFVPMFMLLGYDPALTQVVYRMGDSITNNITPLVAYFAMMIPLAQKYDPEAGMGTLMVGLIPYTVWYFVFWTLLLVAWLLLGLPLGPGGGIHITL